jgi:NADH-quinone oxidoreductase subunit E
MKRYDLRPLKDDFYSRMLELMDKDIKDGENAIFLFEIGEKSADVIYEAGYTLMNSLKFNEVDWTIVVKKVKPEIKPFEEEPKKEKEDNDDE